MKAKWFWTILFTAVAGSATAQTRTITGEIKDAETRQPLPHANLYVYGTNHGTTSDESGRFSLTLKDEEAASKIIASFIGYRTDTIRISSRQVKHSIYLKPDFSSLQEVVVISGTLKEVSKLSSPIPVEVYTPALFLKNPTPNIFESLTMVNGVQPQLNCNVCNTGDIHINGMEGPYTMVLIDGMPIVSSLSTVYGLAGIPNSMVKRIEVVKGPASTLYGSEAVAGLINIITKDPAMSPRFKADVSATSVAEYNIDISTKWKIKKAQALLGVNYFNYQNKLDINDDNFTDVTQQNRISIFNKWDFTRKENRLNSIAFRYIYEDRWGGVLQWNKNHRGSADVYGESIYTSRVEFIGNYQLPIANQKLFLDYSYNHHLQDSYYGVTKYLADQHVSFTQLRWDKKTGIHDLLVGLPFRYMYYEDNTIGTPEPQQTYLPGIFIQDEITASKKLTFLTGLRYDHHNHHGNVFSPRLSVKFSPDNQNTFRLSAGNGFRVVNLFTEDHAALTGSREVVIENELKPEQSWNMNFNYATILQHQNGFIGLDASVFYTYFTNQIVGDFNSDPNLILYDNLSGHAVSKGVTLNTDISFTSGFKIIGGVTLMDVYRKESDENGIENKTTQLFAPRVSGTYAISYFLDRVGLSIDLTGRLNGPMRLPLGIDDTRPEKSPWFTIMNIQLTKTFTNGFEIYGGVKNLLNFLPKDPILNWEDPNSDRFDTTYNYSQVQGIKGFIGVRYTWQ